MVDADDPRDREPVLRVVDVAAIVAILGILLAAPGIYWTLSREPHSDLSRTLLLVLIVPATVVLTAATMWWALRNTRRPQALRCVAIPVLAGAIGLCGLLAAEPLHWHLSKDDFTAVANGAPFPCEPKQRCRLGWWTVSDHARDDSVTIVWFPTGNDPCDGGRGLAHPADPNVETQTLRAAIMNLTHRSSASITRERDGWYRVCAYS